MRLNKGFNIAAGQFGAALSRRLDVKEAKATRKRELGETRQFQLDIRAQDKATQALLRRQNKIEGARGRKLNTAISQFNTILGEFSKLNTTVGKNGVFTIPGLDDPAEVKILQEGIKDFESRIDTAQLPDDKLGFSISDVGDTTTSTREIRRLIGKATAAQKTGAAQLKVDTAADKTRTAQFKASRKELSTLAEDRGAIFQNPNLQQKQIERDALFAALQGALTTGDKSDIFTINTNNNSIPDINEIKSFDASLKEGKKLFETLTKRREAEPKFVTFEGASVPLATFTTNVQTPIVKEITKVSGFSKKSKLKDPSSKNPIKASKYLKTKYPEVVSGIRGFEDQREAVVAHLKKRLAQTNTAKLKSKVLAQIDIESKPSSISLGEPQISIDPNKTERFINALTDAEKVIFNAKKRQGFRNSLISQGLDPVKVFKALGK